jgi:hypothetical protein
LGADESQLEEVLTTYVPVIDYDCERAAINRFEDKYEKLTDYSLKYVRFLVTVCESGYNIPLSPIIFLALQPMNSWE